MHVCTLSAPYWWSMASTHRILPYSLCFSTALPLWGTEKCIWLKAPRHKRRTVESISHRDKQGGNACVRRRRGVKRSEIVVEGFKASTKEMNQNSIWWDCLGGRETKSPRGRAGCRQHRRAGRPLCRGKAEAQGQLQRWQMLGTNMGQDASTPKGGWFRPCFSSRCHLSLIQYGRLFRLYFLYKAGISVLSIGEGACLIQKCNSLGLHFAPFTRSLDSLAAFPIQTLSIFH